MKFSVTSKEILTKRLHCLQVVLHYYLFPTRPANNHFQILKHPESMHIQKNNFRLISLLSQQ